MSARVGSATAMCAAVLAATAGMAFVALPASADPDPGSSGRPTYNDPGTVAQLSQERADDARRQARRETPAEQAERHAARTRYKGMGRREAADLARRTFAGSFSEEGESVLAMKPGDEIVRYVGDFSAVVHSSRGNALATSTIPLRSTLQSGVEKPVDLGLDVVGGKLEPRNPLQPTQFSTDAGGAVEFPGKFSIGADGAGTAEPGILVSNDVFYGGVATDTDLWAMPRYDGANVEWQLRSEDSPESLALGLDLPAGTTLASTGDGSVAVQRGGEQIAMIGTPGAFDADGVDVPASLRQVGDHVVVDVPHRSGDFHYPIVVDPSVTLDQNWQAGQNDTGWTSFENTNGGATFSMFFNNSDLGKGLYVRRRAGSTYGLGTYGQWEYHAIRNAYVERVDFRVWNHENANTNSTTGIWAFNQADWDFGGASRTTRSDTFYGVYPTYYGSQPGNMALMSLGIPNGGVSSSIGTAYTGGAVTYEADYNDPWLGMVRDDIGSGWIDNATGLIGFDAHDDGGIGVQHVTWDGPGESAPDRWQGCAGYAGSRCPDVWPGLLFYLDTASMGEGLRYVQANVWDATGRGGSNAVPVRIDRTPPDIALSGNLYDNRATPIAEDTRALHVTASDGAASPDSAQRSGVKSIEVLVDGARVDYVEQGCSQSCGMSRDFTWTADDYTNNAHTITVRATDQIGHSRDSVFTVQNDSIEPVVDVSGSLWDKNEGVTAGLSYGLSIDASDGDATDPESGVASVTIKVDRQQVYTSSSCSGATCTITPGWQFRPADYSEGDHQIEVVTKDAAGNADVESVTVTVSHVPALPANSPSASANADVTINGAAQLDGAGTAVAGLGDINGDGVDDYAIGAPHADDNGRSDSGTVYVLYGQGTGVIDLAHVDEQGFRIMGATAGDLTGTSIASVGDVNGDDVPDLAIGAPRTFFGLGLLPGQGKVYIVFGNASGDPVSDIDLASLGTRGFQITGPSAPPDQVPAATRPDHPFGSVIGAHQPGEFETTGDVNGDGYDDVVLGSSDESNNSRELSGSAYVVFGKPDVLPVDLNAPGSRAFRIDGPAVGAQAGYAAAIPGDVDGDGNADVLVGSPGASASGRTDGGSAYVIRGSETPPAGVDLAAVGAAGYPIYGAAGEKLGSAVSPAGDVDGDQLDDFAVGGRNTRVTFGTVSTAPMDFGASPAPAGYTITGPANGGDIPVLVGGDDLDEDAAPDMLIGYPDNGGGSLFAVFGQDDGDVTSSTISLDALPGQRGSQITGATGNRVGASAAAIDDSDSELPGILVGAPAVGSPTGSSGNTRLHSGSAYLVRSDKLASGAKRNTYGPPGDPPCLHVAHSKKRTFYKHRQYPYCFSKASDFPDWRLTHGYDGGHHNRKDITLRSKSHGNGRINLTKRLATGRQGIYDSFGDEIGGIAQTRKHRFVLYHANSTDASTGPGATKPHSGARLQATGRACMVDDAKRRTYVLVALIAPAHNPSDSRKLAFRAFMKQSSLNGVPTTRFDRYDMTCGKRSLYGSRARQRQHHTDLRSIPARGAGASGDGAFKDEADTSVKTDLDLYQSKNALAGCATTDPDCGETLSNYFEPRWGATDYALITSATTGVHGGGYVRGVVPLPHSFRRLDQMEYTDLNVPCQHAYSAKWFYGDANPGATGAANNIYGWTPEKKFIRDDTLPGSPPKRRTGSAHGC